MDEETRTKIAEVSKDIGGFFAKVLKQELRFHEGAWWLFSLGVPARLLRSEEVEEARREGRLNG